MFDIDTGNSSFKTMPMNLATHVKTYEFNSDLFAPLEKKLFEKIHQYDPEYGEYLDAHLKRTAGQLGRVLLAYGMGEDDAKKIQHAFILHDVGKILQPVSLWQLSAEKPSSDVKRQRSEHVFLGQQVIDDTVKDVNLDVSNPDNAKHLKLIHYFALTHHERLCGKGPLGWKEKNLDPVLRIATIIDEIDGKYKISNAVTLDDIFKTLKSDKHKGQFDLDMINLCEQVLVHEAAPRAQVQNHGPRTLAL